MNTHTSLADQLLIAMPGLEDPNFSRTVTYLCQHSEDGAMGLVINRPLEFHLNEVLEQMEIETSDPRIDRVPVYLGGPVQPERGFVLHTPVGEWDSSIKLNDELAITTSRDILEAMAKGEGPEQYFVALGYAGWSAGQLEQEMVENAWLSGPAKQEILFELETGQRWTAAAAALGVDLTLISSVAGHS